MNCQNETSFPKDSTHRPVIADSAVFIISQCHVNMAINVVGVNGLDQFIGGVVKLGGVDEGT